MPRLSRLAIPPLCALLVALAASVGIGAAQSPSMMIGTPRPTPVLSMTPSPTPFMPEATPEAVTACVPPPTGDVPSPAAAIDAMVAMLNDEPLRDYFNAGGTVAALRTVLETAGNEVGPYLSQVIEADVDGDGIPEIFVALTDALIDLSYGETHLLMFRCVDGKYADAILFRRAGAGGRAEGLYTGGGAHVLSIADLTGNGATDLLVAVDWRDEFGTYAEYYALEWQDGDFQSIIAIEDPIMMTTVPYIQSQTIGDVAIEDLDGDGVYELVVDGVTYRWDGTTYAADQAE